MRPRPQRQTPGPTAATLDVIGDPICVAGVKLAINLSARQIAFAYAKNKTGQLVATLIYAASGTLGVNISQPNLEAGVLAIAQRAAASSGVAISKGAGDAHLHLTHPSWRCG